MAETFILMKFSSLAALEVVKMTTSSAGSDENFCPNYISIRVKGPFIPGVCTTNAIVG